MKNNPAVKMLVGLGTAWLIIYVIIYPVLFLAAWLLIFSETWVDWDWLGRWSIFGINFPAFFAPFIASIPCSLLTALINLGLLIFYLVHIITNRVGSETVRILLGVGLFFLPFIAMSIYYYAFIWLDEPPEWALDKRTDM